MRFPSPPALHSSSHEEGHLGSDTQESVQDRPVVCTNLRRIIFLLGQRQKGPFPTGVSNNAHSNIQVTRHARGNSWCVCVSSLLCVCLIYSLLCFHHQVEKWDGSLCDIHEKHRPLTRGLNFKHFIQQLNQWALCQLLIFFLRCISLC